MSCDRWRPMLDAYADDSLEDCLSAEDVTACLEHFSACPSCAPDALRRIQERRAVRAASARFAPSPESRMRVESMVSKQSRAKWRLLPAMGIPRLAAAAAVLGLIVVTVSLWTRHEAREQEIAELLDLHTSALASSNPVDVVSSDRHTVKPWFQGKLPFTFNLPELANTSFKLLGGRLVYFRHVPAAQLIFQLGKHEISVFLVRDQANSLPANAGAAATKKEGFSVEEWEQAGLHYTVVGDASAADIHALGDLLRAAANQ